MQPNPGTPTPNPRASALGANGSAARLASEARAKAIAYRLAGNDAQARRFAAASRNWASLAPIAPTRNPDRFASR